MKDFLTALKHASGTSTLREMIRLVMAADGNAPRKPAELKTSLKAVGVSASSLSNVGKTLSNNGGDFVSVHGGWELRPQKFTEARRVLDELLQQVGGAAERKGAAEGSKPVVFFGHGRSAEWRELKDYVVDRLKCDFIEYNRESTAGGTRQGRLSEMLDRANFALLIMTAEDEMPDGSKRARENVVHEVGLFQGRLGFSRAIVVMQNGCTEFSNLAGTDQIRFKSSPMEKAHEIRDVLVREKLIGA